MPLTSNDYTNLSRVFDGILSRPLEYVQGGGALSQVVSFKSQLAHAWTDMNEPLELDDQQATFLNGLLDPRAPGTKVKSLQKPEYVQAMRELGDAFKVLVSRSHGTSFVPTRWQLDQQNKPHRSEILLAQGLIKRDEALEANRQKNYDLWKSLSKEAYQLVDEAFQNTDIMALPDKGRGLAALLVELSRWSKGLGSGPLAIKKMSTDVARLSQHFLLKRFEAGIDFIEGFSESEKADAKAGLKDVLDALSVEYKPSTAASEVIVTTQKVLDVIRDGYQTASAVGSLGDEAILIVCLRLFLAKLAQLEKTVFACVGNKNILPAELVSLQSLCSEIESLKKLFENKSEVADSHLRKLGLLSTYAEMPRTHFVQVGSFHLSPLEKKIFGNSMGAISFDGIDSADFFTLPKMDRTAFGVFYQIGFLRTRSRYLSADKMVEISSLAQAIKLIDDAIKMGLPDSFSHVKKEDLKKLRYEWEQELKELDKEIPEPKKEMIQSLISTGVSMDTILEKLELAQTVFGEASRTEIVGCNKQGMMTLKVSESGFENDLVMSLNTKLILFYRVMTGEDLIPSRIHDEEAAALANLEKIIDLFNAKSVDSNVTYVNQLSYSCLSRAVGEGAFTAILNVQRDADGVPFKKENIKRHSVRERIISDGMLSKMPEDLQKDIMTTDIGMEEIHARLSGRGASHSKANKARKGYRARRPLLSGLAAPHSGVLRTSSFRGNLVKAPKKGF